MRVDKNIFEIIFYGRGGQGAKAAAEILAQAANQEGKFVQAFPYFGAERSGAPTKTYVRVSESPIRNHEPVVDPDLVVVLDDTLMGLEGLTENLDRYESLIVNSTKSAEELAQKVPDFKGKIYPIDATGISLRTVGDPRPNAPMLGKIIQISELLDLETVKEEFRNLFEEKIGKGKAEKNLQAMERGYDSV